MRKSWVELETYGNTLTQKNAEKNKENDATKTKELEAAGNVHLVNSVRREKGFLVTP